MQSESSTNLPPERESADGDDLEVEPVATLPGTASRIEQLPPAARVERLRRLALELRVAGLEAELERARRRQNAVIAQYEDVLAERDEGADDEDTSADVPFFSWLPRS